MKYTTTAYLVASLLAAPLFAGNDKDITYLALGDSIPFGMNITLLPPYSNQLPTAFDFVGYPEVIAQGRHIGLLNPSCPGESSGSFLDVNVPDYGCNSPHPQPPGLPPIPPFRSLVGLRATYADPTQSQMAFAEAELKANKKIKLVTLNIGANDVFLVFPALAQCGDDSKCAQGVLGPVLGQYAANLAQILTRIRALYKGKLVVMTYYSPSPALDGIAVAVNQTMTQVVDQLNEQKHWADVIVANGFIAFQLASAPFGGDACQAGLLVRLPPTPPGPPCDVHPSESGRNLLAATVALTLWDDIGDNATNNNQN
jgi:lysophospholipase L1-like esterase